MNEQVKYVIFLRGINVGGSNVIRMSDLKQVFEHSGFCDVKTYIQSGNVLCSSTKDLLNNQIAKMQEELKSILNDNIPAFCFSLEEIEILKEFTDSFFAENKKEGKYYLTFTDADIPDSTLFPLELLKEGVILHCRKNNVIISESLPMKNGYGFPNKIIEKLFQCKATTRNLHILNKLLVSPK